LIAGRIREDFRNIYRYDAQGRRIEGDMRWGDFGGERRICLYNDFGDVIEEKIEQLAGAVCDYSQCWSEHFLYQYDDRGNWTERVTRAVTQDGTVRESMIARRTLRYY
jgi:hypothetical protein